MDDVIFVQTASSQAAISKQWQVIAFDPACMRTIDVSAGPSFTEDDAEDAYWVRKADSGMASGRASDERMVAFADRLKNG